MKKKSKNIESDLSSIISGGESGWGIYIKV